MDSNPTNQSSQSSASRALTVRLRADVEFRRQEYQGRDYWVAKDPVTLKYYRFEDEEYFLLTLIDGHHSPAQIKRKFDYEFAPQKITLQELYQFIGMLHRSCLVVSDEPGQGVALRERGRKRRLQQWRASLTNILAFRLKGFDPDRLLTFLDRYTGWFFTWPATLVVLFAAIVAAGLVLSQFETLTNRLPGFHEFFSSSNWFWLAATIALSKILHEFGHGLACKRFGGRCHEMGVMFLVMTPCLYCNVSDAWMLPDKWKRAFIAAAGMYVELVLVVLAVFVWWFSHPGLVNQLALNMIVVTSVSTLLFNANPLLRYDGYYILADLLEIPNLRQKAGSVLTRMLADWCLGIPARPDPFMPTRRKWLFVSYSLAAVLYRWLITFTIFWFLYKLFEPYGLKVIGQGIALMAIWGLIGMPLVKLFRFFSVPGRMLAVKPVRLLVSCGVVGSVVAVVLFLPVPHYVRCCFYLQPQDVDNLYVELPGTIQAIYRRANEMVNEGEPILKLTNPELDSTLERLRRLVAEREADYWAIYRIAQRDISRSAELDTALAELESARADLAQREKDLPLTTVAARKRGVVLAPRYVKPPDPDSDQLAAWHGTPLEPRNVGAYLEQQTLVARIVPDPRKFEAIMAVDQADIEFVRPDQPVELIVTETPGTVFRSALQFVSPTRMKSVPPALSSRRGGPLVTTVDSNGNDVPQSTTYLVAAPVDSDQLLLVDGATGRAKIRVGSMTLGQKLWRTVLRTFRFEM